MITKNLITAFATSLLLSACVTMEPNKVEKNESKSQAYNIAHAGGLITGIRDTDIPKDGNKSMTDSEIYQSLSAMNGLINPPLGLTSFQSFSANLLTGLLTPSSHGARSSVIAWLPASMAKDSKSAQEVMMNILEKSVRNSLQELGLKSTNTNARDGRVTFFVNDEKLSCKPISAGVPKACMITVRVFEPTLVKRPDFVEGNEESTWQFTSAHGHYFNNIEFSLNKESPFSTAKVIELTSQKTEPWVYFYAATNDSFTNYSKREKTKLPMLMSAGKPLFFVK